MNKEYQEATNEYLKVCTTYFFHNIVGFLWRSWFGFGRKGSIGIESRERSGQSGYVGHTQSPDFFIRGEADANIPHSHKTRNPFRVSHPKATSAKAKCKAHRSRRSKGQHILSALLLHIASRFPLLEVVDRGVAHVLWWRVKIS